MVKAYSARRDTIQQITDNEARELLERRSSRIYAFPVSPEIAKSWVEACGGSFPHMEPHLQKLREPEAKFGPSVDWLLDHARRNGVEGEKAWDTVRLSALREPIVGARAPMSETPDRSLNAHVDSDQWSVRPNDSPDQFLFTLSISGREKGHFMTGR